MSEARIAVLVSVLSLLISLSPRGRADTPVSFLPATCTVGDKVFLTTTSTNYWCTATNVWTAHSISGGGAVPTGSIVMVNSGSCPTGYTELTALAGLYPLGTTVANADAGTTGGSTSYTPAGSVAAPVFTGTSGTVPAETIAWPAGVPTFSGTAQTFATVGEGTSSSTAMTTPNPYTPAGTVAWPAGVPTNSTASFTPAGTNSAPAFTGTAATIQAPFEKVIFCKAP